MKKLLLISASVVAVLFLIAAIKTYESSSSFKAESAPSAAKTSMKREIEKEPLYIIKSYDDKIGIFAPGSDTPIYSLSDVMVKALPEYDRNLLKTGIEVYSEEELWSLVEDYDS